MGRFRGSERGLTLPAFAKVNLVLRVLGRRPDDYHELYTIFQTITLSDRLTFEPLEGERLELTCDTEGIPTDERNLVRRAAEALRERFRVRRGARVHLEKGIPSEAGLGGGSTDAAVTLLALAFLWEVGAGRRELEELGARLGADVPFFLTGGTATGRGLGTEIDALDDLPETPLVVVTPGVKVSTAEAYRALRAPALTKTEAPVKLPISRAEAQFAASLCEMMQNDFEPVIYRLRPEIARARDALTKAGALCALLAGSGSSVFGLFESRETAERARLALRAETDWQVFICRTLGRDEYRRALGACAALL